MAGYDDFLQRYGMGGSLGAIGAGIGGLFGGGKSPGDAANPYYKQIPDAIGGYYNPYIDAGRRAMGNLEGQYGDLLNNPGGKLNQIGQSFHESPGFQFALQQALGGANRSAAAGGMAGSPSAQQHAMEIGTQLGNQDYYNWLGGATGLYGQGLQGEQDLTHLGFQGSNNMANAISNNLAQQGNLAYQNQAYKNQQRGNAFGNLFGGLGGLAAFAGLGR